MSVHSSPESDVTALRLFLECPCCGDVGAEADEEGLFTDGQKLVCGCPGWVSVDAENEPFINNGDEPCEANHD